MERLLINNPNMLKDALHNCSKSVIRGDSSFQEYGRGIFLGVISTFMALQPKLDFRAALLQALAYLPEDFDQDIIPEVWKKELNKM